MTEQELLNLVRLKAQDHNMMLWRNNSGVARSDAGRPVRFGLANDSKKLNDVFKSSDLIGIKTHTITADDVGKAVGIFVAYEVKRPGWEYTGTSRELAQKAFLDFISRKGGISKFISSLGEV